MHTGGLTGADAGAGESSGVAGVESSGGSAGAAPSEDTGGTTNEGGRGDGSSEPRGGSSEPTLESIRVRFVNALYGARAEQDASLNYELFPFDPFIVDVYLQGHSQALFAGVPPGSERAVTAPVELALTALRGNRELRVEVRTSGASPESQPLIISESLRVPAGGSATFIAAGDPGPNAPSHDERAVILGIAKDRSLPGEQRNAHFIAATHQREGDAEPWTFSENGRALAVLGHFDQEAVSLGHDVTNLSLASSAAEPSLVSFTVPKGLLARQRRSLVILTGLSALRPASDPLGLSLLIVPDDREGPSEPVRVLQDPLLGLVNCLRSTTGHVPTVDIVTNSAFLIGLDAKTPLFLPIRPSDTQIVVWPTNSVGHQPIFDWTPLNLEPGRRFLALLSGAPDASDTAAGPVLTLVEDRFGVDPRRRQARLVNAVVGAPSLELGTWAVVTDDERGPEFTPSLGPAAFLEEGGLTDQAFLLPGETLGGPAMYGYFGVHVPSTEEYSSSELATLRAEPSFLVVVGNRSADALDLLQIGPRRSGWAIVRRTLIRL